MDCRSSRHMSLRFVTVLFVLGVPLCAAPGIKNFDRVDARVYRGGPPTEEGFRYLSQLGVKMIIDLREPGERSQAEERIVSAAGMKYVNVPMSGLTPPTDRQMATILKLLEETSSGPVFVHCMRGADRTGAVIAAYHIDHDKWDNQRALHDAKAHRMSFFQIPRERFIRSFQPVLANAPTPAADTVPLAAPASAELSAR